MNVYDFDNTIYDGESCFDLFRFYARKDPKLLLLLPQVLGAFGKYKQGKVTAEAFLQAYAPLVEQKLREIEDIEGDMRVFWDAHMHKIKPLYAAMQREDDWIITAAPDFSMREVCARLGVRHYLASTMETETCRITHFNLRQNKIQAFLQACPDGRIDRFFTDSPRNDAPLIKMAQSAFVVRGHRITQIK